MAMLTITFTNSAEMTVDEAASVRVPGGTAEAGSLSVGDLVCMFPDGTEVYEIATIE
jgi:hypothetical protein